MGFRQFCDKEECKKNGIAYLASRRGSYLRDYGIFDYVGGARKTFLVEDLNFDEYKEENANNKNDSRK